MSSSAATEQADPDVGRDWVDAFETVNVDPGNPQSRTQVRSAALATFEDVGDSDEAAKAVAEGLKAGQLADDGDGVYVAGYEPDLSNNNVESEEEDSVAEKPDPSEMERDALESEVTELRDRVATLEDDFGRLEEVVFDLQDIVTGDLGRTAAHAVTEQAGGVMERLEDLESEGVSNTNVDRSRMLPAHRMWEDYKAADGDGMKKSQRRTGVLFGEFVRTVTGEGKTVVDASGQLFTMNTSEAREALEDEDQLDGVADQSKSTLVARVMRDVHAMTKTEDCDCEDVSRCGHAMVDFRSGKPHVLAVPKQQFVQAMNHAYGADEVGDGDATTDDPSEQDGEDLADDEIGIDELTNAGTEADR